MVKDLPDAAEAALLLDKVGTLTSVGLHLRSGFPSQRTTEDSGSGGSWLMFSRGVNISRPSVVFQSRTFHYRYLSSGVTLTQRGVALERKTLGVVTWTMSCQIKHYLLLGQTVSV